MRVTATVVLLAAMLVPRPSRACSPAFNERHELDPAHAGDAVPPTAPVIHDVSVQRDEDEGGGCSGEPASECGDLASIQIDLEAMDDLTPVARMGYVARVVSGDPPDGFRVEPSAVGGGTHLNFFFSPDHEASFDFELELRAVDLNGNVGAPFVVRIADDGASGCTTSHGTGSSAVLALGVLTLLMRRRRSRITVA